MNDTLLNYPIEITREISNYLLINYSKYSVIIASRLQAPRAQG